MPKVPLVANKYICKKCRKHLDFGSTYCSNCKNIFPEPVPTESPKTKAQVWPPMTPQEVKSENIGCLVAVLIFGSLYGFYHHWDTQRLSTQETSVTQPQTDAASQPATTAPPEPRSPEQQSKTVPNPTTSKPLRATRNVVVNVAAILGNRVSRVNRIIGVKPYETDIHTPAICMVFQMEEQSAITLRTARLGVHRMSCILTQTERRRSL